MEKFWFLNVLIRKNKNLLFFKEITIKAEGVGILFKNLGKTSTKAVEKMASNVKKNILEERWKLV